MIAKCLVLLAVVAQISAAACNQQTVPVKCGSCPQKLPPLTVSNSGNGGVLTKNIVVKGKYPVKLCNCGPTPDKQIPVITTHVQAPVQEKPTVRLPARIPAPKTISHTCTCYKTVIRPRVHQQIISVPVVHRFIETTHKPVVENIHYEACPVNCEPEANCKYQAVEVSANGASTCGTSNSGSCGTCGVSTCGTSSSGSCGTCGVQTVQVPTCGASSSGSCGISSCGTCGVQTVQIPTCGTSSSGSCGTCGSCGVQTVQVPTCGTSSSGTCGNCGVQTVQIPSSGSCGTCGVSTFGTSSSGSSGMPTYVVSSVQVPTCETSSAPTCRVPVVEVPTYVVKSCPTLTYNVPTSQASSCQSVPVVETLSCRNSCNKC